MNDQVRDSRTFEPPPWEREQFDELRRQRELEQAQRDPVARQGAAPQPQGTESERAAAPPRGDPAQVGTPANPGTPPAPTEVDLMMMRLSDQEPDVSAPLRLAGLVLAGIVAVVGLATVIAGVGGMVLQAGRGGPMGTAAGFAVVAFGTLLMAGGGWLTIQTLRQRGA